MRAKPLDRLKLAGDLADVNDQPGKSNCVASPRRSITLCGYRLALRLLPRLASFHENLHDENENGGGGGMGCRVAFSPDGKTLAVDRGDQVGVWDLQTGRERRSWPSKQITIDGRPFAPDGTLLAFTPDGGLLASAGNADRNIKLLDVNTGAEVRTLKGHQYMIRGIAISRDGKWLASGSVQLGSTLGEIKVWEISTGKEVASYHSSNEGIKVLEFTPDGQTLLAVATTEIRLWRLDFLKGQAP